MSWKGKCTNLANCVLAYRGEEVEAPENAFVCPECGKPLTSLEKPPAAARSKLVPILAGAAIVVVVALLVYWAMLQLKRVGPMESGTEPAEEVSPVEGEVAPEAVPPAPAAQIDPPPSAPTADTTSAVPGEIDLDPQSQQNAEVKAEVLKRIDLMPTISAENKDKLYFSVERARQMGKIVKIPFAFGQRALSEAEIEALRTAIENERVQDILEDPTAVLVLLGYADAKGDEEKNLKISQDRAESVEKTLKDQLNVLNVMHSVGMGSSTLFDESGNEKNRVVEVWVVLP